MAQYSNNMWQPGFEWLICREILLDSWKYMNRYIVIKGLRPQWPWYCKSSDIKPNKKMGRQDLHWGAWFGGTTIKRGPCPSPWAYRVHGLWDGLCFPSTRQNLSHYEQSICHFPLDEDELRHEVRLLLLWKQFRSRSQCTHESYRRPCKRNLVCGVLASSSLGKGRASLQAYME